MISGFSIDENGNNSNLKNYNLFSKDYLKIDQITNFAEIAKCQIIIFVLLSSYLKIAQLLAKSNALVILVSVPI